MDQVITLLSSDEEVDTEEVPTKKIKLDSECGMNDASGILSLNSALDAEKDYPNGRVMPSTNSNASNVTSNNQTSASSTYVISDDNDEDDKNETSDVKNNAFNLIIKDVKTVTEEDDFSQNDATKSVDDNANSTVGVSKSDVQEEAILLNQKNQEDSFSLPRPASSTDNDTTTASTDFLEKKKETIHNLIEICRKTVKGTTFEERLFEKFPKLLQFVDDQPYIFDDTEFCDLLQSSKSEAQQSPANAVSAFKSVFCYLRDYQSTEIIVEEEDVPRLRHMENIMGVLIKRINHLDKTVVHGSSSSSYVQADKYKHRLQKIYQKYCSIIKRSPLKGRLIHQKITCKTSIHPEINMAVTKHLKKCKFPTYYDVETCIRKCVQQSDTLKLREDEIRNESRTCFEYVGNLLQMRRKRELFDFQSDYIKNSVDPAETDVELNKVLVMHSDEGKVKIEKLVNYYASQQECNAPVEPQSDDDSDNSCTESDNNDNDSN